MSWSKAILLVALVSAWLFVGELLPASTHPTPATVGVSAPDVAPPTGHVQVLAQEQPLSDLLELTVSHSGDRGAGSLRDAILQANAHSGPASIAFGGADGAFADPHVIELESALPDLVGDLTIDGYIPDRLWQATGVTVSGGSRDRVFVIAPTASVTLRSFALANGSGEKGGAILNHGDLIIDSVTFVGNRASAHGGAISNESGTLHIVNSTFVDNQAGAFGGAVFDATGVLVVTNSTFTENASERGGALFSDGAPLLRNSILANSDSQEDCVAADVAPASTHNLIERSVGCGAPISTEDPRMGQLGYYNGPVQTIPLGGGSPAINLGDNAAAVGPDGERLVWDQRGNGDPRVVAGFTDLGAFEQQANPDLTVDAVGDPLVRGCTRATIGDCPLRAAIEIANAMPGADTIAFHESTFQAGEIIQLARPLPHAVDELTIDASAANGATVRGAGSWWTSEQPPENVTIIGVRFE